MSWLEVFFARGPLTETMGEMKTRVAAMMPQTKVMMFADIMIAGVARR